MARKIFTTEQIIGKLREAEVLLSQGQPLGMVCRGLEISEQTYYRWRKEYGGLRTDQAHRLKELERENSRLKKLVADLALDKAMLQEALSVRTVPMPSIGARSHDGRVLRSFATCSTCRSDVRAG